MDKFPRTEVGGLSVSRMIIGTNWFLGYSHCTPSKDELIKQQFVDHHMLADILEVFFRAGVDTLIGPFQGSMLPKSVDLPAAIKEAEDRTGVEAIIISTPMFPTTPETPVSGFDRDEVNRILDEECQFGAKILMPHTCTTDAVLDRCTRRIRKMDDLCREIRDRGMIPGLSTHLPESVVYADESGLDVETYTVIYNAAGFLMPIEVDWASRIISTAQKPVLTIKPLAAGQLRPLQGLTFVWNTIRDQDMVAIGTLSPREAEEVIEISLNILEKRAKPLRLQETRSKAAVKAVNI